MKLEKISRCGLKSLRDRRLDQSSGLTEKGKESRGEASIPTVSVRHCNFAPGLQPGPARLALSLVDEKGTNARLTEPSPSSTPHVSALFCVLDPLGLQMVEWSIREPRSRS